MVETKVVRDYLRGLFDQPMLPRFFARLSESDRNYFWLQTTENNLMWVYLHFFPSIIAINDIKILYRLKSPRKWLYFMQILQKKPVV